MLLNQLLFCRFKKDFLATAEAELDVQKGACKQAKSVVEAIADRAVEEFGVLLLPASVYGHKTSTCNGHFRVGLGRKNLPECLDKLGQFFQAFS